MSETGASYLRKPSIKKENAQAISSVLFLDSLYNNLFFMSFSKDSACSVTYCVDSAIQCSLFLGPVPFPSVPSTEHVHHPVPKNHTPILFPALSFNGMHMFISPSSTFRTRLQFPKGERVTLTVPENNSPMFPVLSF
jgi:hypothetical protein